jgi:hypothetical protein
MDDLLEIMDQTVEPPLKVHFNLASQRRTISSLLRTNVPTYRFHNSQPLAVDPPGFWRVDLRDHLLGQGLVGWLDKDGQMFAARLGVLSARFPQGTHVALCCVCCISAVEVVPNLGPTGFQLEDFVLGPYVAIVLLVISKIFEGELLGWVRFVAFLGGKAGIALATVRGRTLRIELRLDTRREIGFAMLVAVGAA